MRSVRIAFVAGNREQLPDPVVPLGVLTVMAACSREHERELVDLCFEDEPIAALSERLARIRPDVVALGMRNVHDNDYAATDASVAYYRSLVRATREHAPRATIVVGGGGFSVLPRELLLALGADAGIAGEGESAFAGMLDVLAAGGRLIEAPGVLVRDGERVLACSRPAPPVVLDRAPVPDRSLIDRRHYGRCGTDSVQTKRGCPLGCTYCTYPSIEGRAHRLRDPERVVDEFEDAARQGARHVFVVDAVFNLPARHAHAVCDALVRRGPGLPWTAYVNPIGFDARLAEAMVAAGAVGMEVGSDSGDDAVLARLCKGFDTGAIRRLRATARGAGLLDCHTFILGTPGETLGSVRRTLDLIVELDPAAAILMLWSDERESLEPTLAERRRELRAEIIALLERERPRYPRWVIPQLGVNFRARTFSLLRRRGLAGPLWQHLERLGPGAPAT